MIFNIQRFSTHDGTGIRTILFYKGCPLRCQWCSNPESQSFEPIVMYDHRICKQFGDCIKTNSNAIFRNNGGIGIDRTKIRNVDELRNICATRALIVSGEEKSTAEIMLEIEKDLPFYRHDGGVTLSGGEPLSQGAALIELLTALKKKKIDVSVETSLHVSWGNISHCMGLINTFLVDLKHINVKKFGQFTQGKLDLVIKNLEKLTGFHENVIIRIPVIPDFNHSEIEMKGIIDHVASLQHMREIHFLPYHTLGVEKYNMLDTAYLFGTKKQVDDADLLPYINYAQSKGFITKIGG